VPGREKAQVPAQGPVPVLGPVAERVSASVTATESG
jgi:hypothetical protein